jgi:lipid A 3-O-deacylase
MSCIPKPRGGSGRIRSVIDASRGSRRVGRARQALRRLVVACCLAATAVPAAALPQLEDSAGALMLGAGRWGLKSQDAAATAFDLELRWRPVRYGVFPLLGVLTNTQEGWSPRIGLGRQVPMGARWDATVTFAASAYFAGEGKDLGHTLEFRSALDIGYRVHPALRLGLSVAHFSNAGLADLNPGVETLSLTLTTVPRGRSSFLR